MTPSCGDGSSNWIEDAEAPLGGRGGSHTVGPVTGDLPPGSLAPDLGARVLMGLPCALTWICAVCLSNGRDGESSTRKISMGSSLSSSSSSAFPSPLSLCSSDENL
jgi:hypothetical protein